MACKIDLIDEMNTAVNMKRAQALAVSRGFVACIETSAKTGQGVSEVFNIVAKEISRHNLIPDTFHQLTR